MEIQEINLEKFDRLYETAHRTIRVLNCIKKGLNVQQTMKKAKAERNLVHYYMNAVKKEAPINLENSNA